MESICIMIERCEWANQESMREYHDKEWGLPVHDDRKLFESSRNDKIYRYYL